MRLYIRFVASLSNNTRQPGRLFVTFAASSLTDKAIKHLPQPQLSRILGR